VGAPFGHVCAVALPYPPEDVACDVGLEAGDVDGEAAAELPDDGTALPPPPQAARISANAKTAASEDRDACIAGVYAVPTVVSSEPAVDRFLGRDVSKCRFVRGVRKRLAVPQREKAQVQEAVEEQRVQPQLRSGVELRQ